MTREQLSYKISFAILQTIADTASKKENTQASKDYKSGLITPTEFLKTTKLKDTI